MTLKTFQAAVPERLPFQSLIGLDAPIKTDVLTQTEYEAFRDALPTCPVQKTARTAILCLGTVRIATPNKGTFFWRAIYDIR